MINKQIVEISIRLFIKLRYLFWCLRREFLPRFCYSNTFVKNLTLDLPVNDARIFVKKFSCGFYDLFNNC